MKKDNQHQLSRTTITLHWIVAITIIGLLAVGVYMEENEAYALYPWHKSVGFLIFFVVIARVLWRIKNGWPTPVSQYKRIEHYLAKLVHWALIIGTVLMPISGALMSALGGHGLYVFGLEIIATNPSPNNPLEMVAHNPDLASFSHSAHHLIGEIMIIAVALHILAALKHHLIDKDGTLRRMLGAKLSG